MNIDLDDKVRTTSEPARRFGLAIAPHGGERQPSNKSQTMKSIAPIGLLSIAAFALMTTGCSSPSVQESRSSGVERRQDRIDSRTGARQERWEVRGEREDARASARFDSW